MSGRAVLLMAVSEDPTFVAGLQAGPPVLLVLNKTDLLPPPELAAALAQAADWGYDALPVCAATGGGLTELAERLAGRVTVLAGPSGEVASCSGAPTQLDAAGFDANKPLPRPGHGYPFVDEAAVRTGCSLWQTADQQALSLLSV